MSGETCECVNWATTNMRVLLLTGHHEFCAKGGPHLESAFGLIKELARGIELWGHEEDGIPDCVWHAYVKAKSLEGVFLARGGETIKHAPYRNWGYLNGLTTAEMAVWRAEVERHDREVTDGIGEHRRVRCASNGRTEDHMCSCGFGWMADCSG